MSSNKSKKGGMLLYIFLIIAGCVLACSTIISNDYVKLVIVLACFCVGLYGALKALGGSGDEEETNKNLESHENK